MHAALCRLPLRDLRSSGSIWQRSAVKEGFWVHSIHLYTHLSTRIALESFPKVPPGSGGYHTNRFGIIPKGSSGKWRLIVDMSVPEGASVNDGVSKSLPSLSYVGVPDAVEGHTTARPQGTAGQDQHQKHVSTCTDPS